MKKSIIITIGTVLSLSGAIALGVFIPAAKAMSSSNIAVLNSANFLNTPDKNTQLPVSYKQAILGTKAINNGNYILYLGSQGLDNNVSFMYNIPKHQTAKDFINTKLLGPKPQPELSGDLWNAINYVLNSQQAKNELVTPMFVSYIHSVNNVYAQKLTLLNDLNNILKSIVSQSEDKTVWNKLTTEEQNKVQNKLDYLHQMTNGYITDVKLPRRAEDFQNLPPKDKPVKWEFSDKNLIFSTNPFDIYTNMDNEKIYYLNDGYAENYRNLITYTQTVYPNIVDPKSSPGFVIGFRDGNMVAKYNLSFSEPPPPSDENESTPPSEPPPSPNPNPSSLYKTSSTTTIAKPNSTFYKWIADEFSKTPKKQDA